MRIKYLLISAGTLLVIGVIIWQAIIYAGVPDPFLGNMTAASAILSSGILVFREGLEAILVLSAIVATVTKKKQSIHTKGIAIGTSVGLLATIATWFIIVAILSDINLPGLDIQALTGLIAIIVLLVVMNWFFHKVYWTGWITNHTNRGRRLVKSEDKSPSRMLIGFVLLGFTAIYREGFEVVLFLQQLRLRDGNSIVLTGAAIGIFLTAIVAVLTFILHERLPYKKMLILTGVLLGIVLLVMVGESVQEMQLAHWLPETPINISIPSWLGLWFSVFPNIQSIAAQSVAALLVLGSYYSARHARTS